MIISKKKKISATSSFHRKAWLRFFARVVDTTIFFLLFVFFFVPVGGFIVSNLGIRPGELWDMAFKPGPISILTNLAILAVSVGVPEAILLSYFGSTPGKWLLGIIIRDSKGQKIIFTEALARTLLVWWRGLAIGIPVISLITLVYAYKRFIEKKGMTSWDRDGSCIVSYGYKT